jgi:nicotinamide-nucleotide amidase
MVQGLRRKAGIAIALPAAAIAVSGIAGPGGGSRDKPVGTVHFGFALGEREWVAARRFDGDRDAVRRRAVAFALAQMNAALEAGSRR